MNRMPEVWWQVLAGESKRAPLAGEVSEQHGVACLSEPRFGGISGWGERVRGVGLGERRKA